MDLSSAPLGQLLHRHAHARGDAVALRFEGQSWSYQRLNDAAWQMAAWLQAQGLRQSDRVAYLGYAQPLQIALLFACARIGAVLVPLNFRLAAPEWAGVLGDCAASVLLHDAHWAAAASQLALQQGSKCYIIDSALCPYDGNIGQKTFTNLAHAAVLIVYTSGTTGKAKGAVHTQANLLANMHIASSVQGITPDDLVLTVLPLFHVGGLCIQTLPALYVGAGVLLHARFEAGAVLAAIHQLRPSLTLQVPATLAAMAEHPQWPSTALSSLRTLWVGSSVVPRRLIALWTARGVAVCNVYGSTETGPFSVAIPPKQAHWPQMAQLGACGWPAPQVQLELANARTEGGAQVGELCLKAPNVAQHYWPDTPAVDARGFFHTGDLARLAADGSVCIVGRVKDMVISGGENIYPAELEHILSAHPLVAECVVVGLPDAQWGEVLVAVVVRRFNATNIEALEASLQALLAAQLARYKLPRRWVWLDALPKTALGKVQKSVLLASLAAVLV